MTQNWYQRNLSTCLFCEKIVFQTTINFPMPALHLDSPDGCAFCSLECVMSWANEVRKDAAEERTALEEEDRAVCALAQAADAINLHWWGNDPKNKGELRLPSTAFSDVLLNALNSGTITDWKAWADTEGLKQLQEALKEESS